MKKKIIAVVVGFLMPILVFSYDPLTHTLISAEAAQKSVLSDQATFVRLGLNQYSAHYIQILHTTYRYYIQIGSGLY